MRVPPWALQPVEPTEATPRRARGGRRRQRARHGGGRDAPGAPSASDWMRPVRRGATGLMSSSAGCPSRQAPKGVGEGAAQPRRIGRTGRRATTDDPHEGDARQRPKPHDRSTHPHRRTPSTTPPDCRHEAGFRLSNLPVHHEKALETADVRCSDTQGVWARLPRQPAPHISAMFNLSSPRDSLADLPRLETARLTLGGLVPEDAPALARPPHGRSGHHRAITSCRSPSPSRTRRA